MDLLHNSIADMYGPTFLAFYGLMIVGTYIVCAVMLRLNDRSNSLPAPLIPANPDAYLIAYLRDGETEVARTVVFNLVKHGLLQVAQDAKSIAQSAYPQYAASLSPMERYVFDWFSVPREASEVFQQSSSLVKGIKPFCDYYQKFLTSEQMLSQSELRRTSWLIWLFGAVVIVAIGFYKLQVAIAKGHSNTGFLTIMLIAAPLILLAVCRVPRLSARGKAFLKQLQLAFGSVKKQIKMEPTPNTDAAYILAVGLFGVGMLAGTQYNYFQEMYKSVTSSSNGDGNGGSCGGGGGCGGGCGGCGGA